MEVNGDLGALFGIQPIAVITAKWATTVSARKFPFFKSTIDRIGNMSAQAQGLRSPITSYERLCSSGDHCLYLMWEQGSQPSVSCVSGILKVASKQLYLFDDKHQNYVATAVCVLDFYVIENKQKQGLGKQLFDAMLQREGVTPGMVAYDRPSKALLRFLERWYGLKGPIEQPNNFSVFPEFFQHFASCKIEENQRRKGKIRENEDVQGREDRRRYLTNLQHQPLW